MRKLFTLVCCLFTLSIFGQQSGADSLRSSYFASQSNTLPIYYGRGFLNTYTAIKGSAFYSSINWADGSVKFDNTWFYHIPILFDIYHDELIVQHPNGNAIILFKDRVQAFSFDSLNFVRLALDEKKVKPEYYQVLATGTMSILAKRARILDERIVDNTWHREFLNNYSFYTLKDGIGTNFQNSRQLLKIVKKDGKNISADLKKSKIRFKVTPEAFMTRVAELYNQ